jgi:hypothetical protein
MRSRGWLEITTLRSTSWMPCAPQGVKLLYDDYDILHMPTVDCGELLRYFPKLDKQES